MIKAFTRFIGLENNKTSHLEKLVSGLGGFIGILLTLLMTKQFVAGQDIALIVASMGASAVLLFAVPHGQLSQPWAFVGGHVVSALIGVSCYFLIPNLIIAAACAVGLAVTCMYYLRCIHPPGGATALTAVVAGPGVHSLGYAYVVTPVLLNALILLCVAVAFNFLFHWRRYPAVFMRKTKREQGLNKGLEHTNEPAISQDDLEHALQQMNLYVDISHADLEKIYQLAKNRSYANLTTDHIRIGHYYSNGEYGQDWCVRQIVDESERKDTGRDQIIYKVVAGKARRSSGTVSRDEFARWAKYEVYLNENSWQRVVIPGGVAKPLQPVISATEVPDGR